MIENGKAECGNFLTSAFPLPSSHFRLPTSVFRLPTSLLAFAQLIPSHLQIDIFKTSTLPVLCFWN